MSNIQKSKVKHPNVHYCKIPVNLPLRKYLFEKNIIERCYHKWNIIFRGLGGIALKPEEYIKSRIIIHYSELVLFCNNITMLLRLIETRRRMSLLISFIFTSFTGDDGWMFLRNFFLTFCSLLWKYYSNPPTLWLVINNSYHTHLHLLYSFFVVIPSWRLEFGEKFLRLISLNFFVVSPLTRCISLSGDH